MIYKKSIFYVPIFLFFNGCVIFPSFRTIYTSPELNGILIDKDSIPIENVIVYFDDYQGISDTTDKNGFFHLDAQTEFEKFKIIAMDPPIPVVHLVLKNTSIPDSIIVEIPFDHGKTKKVIFEDTIMIDMDSIMNQKRISSIELDNGIILVGTIEKFDPSNHEYDTCDSGLGWKYICLIDNKIWYGSDAGMDLPRNQLKSLTITIDDQKIELETSGMFNISFGNYIRDKQFYLKKNGEDYFLDGMFSDGAGAYIVQWRIVKGKSERIKISNDEADFE